MRNVGSGVLQSISSLADRSVKLTIVTQELDSTDAARLFEMRNKFIKYLFSDSNIDPASEALLNDLHLQDTRKVKSPSQRLRAVLYLLNKQTGGTEENFDTYYQQHMEEIINHFKAKLDKE